jgi:hypothetical protein
MEGTMDLPEGLSFFLANARPSLHRQKAEGNLGDPRTGLIREERYEAPGRRNIGIHSRRIQPACELCHFFPVVVKTDALVRRLDRKIAKREPGPQRQKLERSRRDLALDRTTRNR